MKYSLLKLTGMAALAAGIAVSQTAPTPNSQTHNRPRARAFAGRMGANLNLTDAQKEQAKSIFSQARQASEPIRSQLQQNRQALAAAVKSNSTAEIDRLTAAMGPLMAQSTAARAKSFAQFYAILTPEQKDKVDSRMDRVKGGAGGFRGRLRKG